MGAFVLFKKDKTAAMNAVGDLMSRKGFRSPHTFELGGYTLHLYDKILIDERNHIVQNNKGLFVSGSLCYKGLGYQDSLDQLYADYINDSIVNEELYGVFAILFSNNGALSLLTDQAGMQNVFYNADHSLISSSFLALMEGCSRLTVNRMAFAECLVTGLSIGPDTLFNEINRYEFYAPPLSKEIRFLNKENDSRNAAPGKGSFNDVVAEQTEALTGMFGKLKNHAEQYGVDSGITGGHDSRLILSIAKDAYKKVSFHTHWRRVKDKEQACAELVCEKAGIPVNVIKITHPLDMNEKETLDTFDKAMLFYDGLTRMHCYFNEMYNTVDYRKKVMQGMLMGLNGIGGEQYRNDEHMILPSWNINRWIKYHVTRYECGDCFTDASFEAKLNAYTKEKIVSKLKLKGHTHINRLHLKRYLNEVFVPAKMGARNNAENQLSFFFSPYTDFTISQNAYKAVPHLGVSFDFEEAMISRVSPEIASVMSDYGFNFIDGDPFKRRVLHVLRELLPFSLKSSLLNKRLLKRGNTYYTELTKKHPIYKEIYEAVASLNLPVNLERITYQPDLIGNIFSLGYLLKTYQHKIDFN